MPLYDPAMYHFATPAPCCWQEMCAPLDVPAAPLAADLDCDVAIIGGGFTGLSAALHLVRDHGLSACVLEAGEPAWGASGRNGGFCSLYPSTLSVAKMDQRFGAQATDAFVASQREAIEFVADLASSEGIEFSRQGDGVYEVAHRPSRYAGFRAEAELYSRRFGIPSRAVPREEFAATVYDSTEQFGGLHTGLGFGLNPLAFARGLARAAVRRGARLHAHSEVLDWRAEGSHQRLLTAGGSVRAPRVIVATNGYTPEGLVPGVAGRNVPVISNIVTTRPLTDAELAAQRWQTEAPCSNTRRMLFYYRLLADRRFLFGARGDTTGSPADATRMRAWITRRLGEVFPAWREVPVTHYWRGFVCMNARGTPMVGALDEANRLLYGLAFHGSGVAAAPWTGRLLARIAAGAAGLDSIPAVMRGPAPRLPFAALRLWYLRAALAWFRVEDRR
jgi:glycine/D-amino acid oxidase-like deaminating enzyme